MPYRSAHPCAYQGCPDLIRGPGRYCVKHGQAEQQQYDKQRGSAASRGYNRAWQRIRTLQLRMYPTCADPFNTHALPVQAVDVDHIIPLRSGGTNEQTNLQSLCHACHSRKTAKENGRWG
jgi:5-methylcytosine-specific restriction enzyme A